MHRSKSMIPHDVRWCFDIPAWLFHLLPWPKRIIFYLGTRKNTSPSLPTKKGRYPRHGSGLDVETLQHV